MILYPKDGSPHVIYCSGTPLCAFTVVKGAAITGFLKYWLGEHTLRPGYDRHGTVNAELDF